MQGPNNNYSIFNIPVMIFQEQQITSFIINLMFCLQKQTNYTGDLIK